MTQPATTEPVQLFTGYRQSVDAFLILDFDRATVPLAPTDTVRAQFRPDLNGPVVDTITTATGRAIITATATENSVTLSFPGEVTALYGTRLTGGRLPANGLITLFTRLIIADTDGIDRVSADFGVQFKASWTLLGGS